MSRRRHKLRSSMAGIVAFGVVGPALPAGASPAPPVAAGINFGSAYEAAYAALPPARQSAVMARIAGSGAQWIRIDVPFSSDEPEPGVYDWAFGAEVTEAIAHGLQVDALVSYAPAWAQLPDGEPNPVDTAAFANAAASHFAPMGVHTWEIWNEPNLESSWGGPVDPVGYATLLEAVDPAIKEVDPTATVLSGGLARAPDVPLQAVDAVSFLEGMYTAGAEGSFDGVADHPYSFPDLPGDDDPSVNAYDQLPTLHQVMVDFGDGAKQIWITEYGAPTSGAGAVDEQTQAEMITSAFSTAAQSTWIGPLMVFDWRDTTGDGGFGLVTATGQAKPSLGAYESAASQY